MREVGVGGRWVVGAGSSHDGERPGPTKGGGCAGKGRVMGVRWIFSPMFRVKEMVFLGLLEFCGCLCNFFSELD
ncbi:hypothetical protein OIU84_006854 [Salix udensis]|uniref:Uncharacterized protein n=1 Tax=Salix udensis TaxID=889485 RepID=A0AAD6P2Z8_9ROSI|nr:hypothetical protein OIU84_006854 [Salix udensis]